MRNFLGLMASILISVFAISCDGQVRELDMTSKGIVKARVIVVENSSFSRYNATKIFFKKLDSSNDLEKGKIIATEVKDDTGSLMINYEPGTYVLIGAIRSSSDSKIFVVFNEAVIRKSMMELKAGETADMGKIEIAESSASLLGDVEDIQVKNRKAIGQDFSSNMYYFRLGDLTDTDKMKIRQNKAKEAKEEKPVEKVEEFK